MKNRLEATRDQEANGRERKTVIVTKVNLRNSILITSSLPH